MNSERFVKTRSFNSYAAQACLLRTPIFCGSGIDSSTRRPITYFSNDQRGSVRSVYGHTAIDRAGSSVDGPYGSDGSFGMTAMPPGCMIVSAHAAATHASETVSR